MIRIPPRTAVIELVPEFRPTISPIVVMTPDVAPKNKPVRAPSLLKNSMSILPDLGAVEANLFVVSRHCNHSDERESELFDQANGWHICLGHDRGQLANAKIIARMREHGNRSLTRVPFSTEIRQHTESNIRMIEIVALEEAAYSYATAVRLKHHRIRSVTVICVEL